MSPEAERTTRKQRIDPRLTRAGWHVKPFRPELPVSGYTEAAVEEYETANGPADYALCDGGHVRGIVRVAQG
jgi:type I restriction enzyme, R subunit